MLYSHHDGEIDVEITHEIRAHSGSFFPQIENRLSDWLSFLKQLVSCDHIIVVCTRDKKWTCIDALKKDMVFA